ncbi:hypothetical protein FB45DRAFT_886536 [Roridomyces roridus]|uniref:AAA-ATPase-like domain-containing protein n=1 Tax=Roridomyces roridus TaxID=1738132 RepID=A0AAD7CIS8_9AGAR|nr:hypothetical protein FB45DRAFT_886536 [Roridomyces roridus]
MVSCNHNHLRLPGHTDQFLDFHTHPRPAHADKTRFAFKLPANYRYLLLRPPKFGKTAFLSTLHQFYDIHGAETFSHYFRNHPRDHSQHLCLPLTFRDIGVYDSPEDFEDELQYELFSALRSFLVKYATELGLAEPQTYLEYGENESLKKVLNRVRERQKTLFVGVDSYDVPLMKCMRSRLVYPAIHPTFVTPQDVARLLDEYVWEPLRDAGDVTAKLFVTGTLSLQTPILRDLVILAHDLQSCCGFTEGELIQFVQSIHLENTLDIADLKGQCGCYTFPAGNSISEPVLHPRLLIDFIKESESVAFFLFSSLLDHLPLVADSPNVVTIQGLIDLVASGVVEIQPVDLDAGHDLDGISVSWAALYHAGALTGVPGSNSAFRLANGKVLSLIHSRIDKIVHDRYYNFSVGDKEFSFLDALAEYHPATENHQLLVHLLTKILCEQTQRYLGGNMKEPILPGLIELIMRNATLLSCSPSLLLEPILTLPADAPCVRLRAYFTDRILRWELKTLPLVGFWRAVNPNDTEPSVEALRTLHEEMCLDDDEKLSERWYSVWSESLQVMETRAVRTFFKAGAAYTQLIAVGGARILRREGPEEVLALPPP